MKRKYVILLHVGFWVLFSANNIWNSVSRGILTDHQIAPLTFGLFGRYAVIEAGYMVITLACFYTASLLVAPLLARRRIVKALLLTAATIVFCVGYRYLVEYYFFKPVLGFDNYRGNVWGFNHYVSNIVMYYFPSYFVYGLMYFFITEWYHTRHRQQALEKEKSAAELTFLRSQLNPHFLFNSINDIYSLTYQQSEQAPAALLKLSDILRYMLREGGEDTMPLQSEVKYLENVIELQRISTKGAACINFSIEGYIGTQQIATLLLIAFVENAFKHGLLTDPANPIEISLFATDAVIKFSVHNKKNRHQKDKTPGIGLSNVRRRLELMYPGCHSLTINDDDQIYTVTLTLQLL